MTLEHYQALNTKIAMAETVTTIQISFLLFLLTIPRKGLLKYRAIDRLMALAEVLKTQ